MNKLLINNILTVEPDNNNIFVVDQDWFLLKGQVIGYWLKSISLYLYPNKRELLFLGKNRL